MELAWYKVYPLGIDEGQTIPDAAFSETILHLGSDVHEGSPGRDIKPKFFAVASISALLFPDGHLFTAIFILWKSVIP